MSMFRKRSMLGVGVLTTYYAPYFHISDALVGAIAIYTGRCRCSLECLWHSKEQMRHIKSRRGANAKRIQDLSGEFKMERLIIKME